MRYKTTGCFKFFIALLIMAPLAFLGASYIQGEDPLASLRNMISTEDKSERVIESDSDLQQEVKRLERSLKFYKSEVEKLEKDLKACQTAKTEI